MATPPTVAAVRRRETAPLATTPTAAASNGRETKGTMVPHSGHVTEGTGSDLSTSVARKAATKAILGGGTRGLRSHGSLLAMSAFPQTWTDISNTEAWLTAHCSTVWTSSVGKYQLPFSVEFGTTGSFQWLAPFASGAGEEHGSGTYLGLLHTTMYSNGSWETSYFSANRFTPDPKNSTRCCCEYVGQDAGVGQPRVLADYCTATVPHSSHLPLEEVCAPHVRQCPFNNATALAELGRPFIQVFSPCAPFAEGPSSSFAPQRLLQHCLVLLVAVVAAVQLAGIVCKARRAGPPQIHGLNEALL